MEHNLKTIKYKGRVVFQKLKVSTFTRIPKEYYENEACFIFVNQGEFRVRSQTERLHINKETALLAKCLNYFYETSKKTTDNKDNIEVIGLLFYPELAKDLFDVEINNSNYSVDYNLKQIEVNQLLQYFRESIGILLDNPELADEHLIKTKLREFVILMTKTVKAPSEMDFLASMFKPNFAKFEDIIQQNLHANLDVNQLAFLCHMSLSTFKRKFQEVYNASPAKYISKMKIDKAVDFLLNKNLRISDIAYDLGYNSLTSFNRVFKEQTGKSPSEYRMD